MATKSADAAKNIEKTLQSISNRKSAPKWGFVVLVLLYVGITAMLGVFSRSEDVIFIMGTPTPLRVFSGALAALGNLSFIALALFYEKPGFITALIFLIYGFASLIVGMVVSKDFSNIPGLFMAIVTLVTVTLIYFNNQTIKRYQGRIVDQAVTDRLTGLPNRFACSELADDLVKRNDQFAVAYFNLDNFKSINNTMGQKTGDDVLVAIGERLKDAAGKGVSGTLDFVTHQGGDEFAFIIRNFESEEDLVRTIKYYESVIEEPLTLDDCDYFLSAAIGYAVFPADAKDADSILSFADTAVEVAKRFAGDDRIARFAPDMLDIEQTLETERKIRAALDNDTLYFNLQPQYDMEHRLSGFEALARMKDADGNMISPAEFIPVAEKVNLVDKIDVAVFRKSAKFFGDLVAETGADIKLSINVSVKHLMKNNFIEELKDVLATSGMPADRLEIEITESIMIDSAEKALHCIQDIKDLGIRIAIDDFGTGYSSLSYLNSFPADVLKVDKAFIDKMNLNDSSKQYVAAIISIGHVMNFAVISEGVEEHDQLETLRTIGCDYIQGFIWGRPMEPADAAELVYASVRG